MQLDPTTKSQLEPILAALKSNFTFQLYLPPHHPEAQNFTELFEELCALSPKLELKHHQGEDLLLRVSKEQRDLGILFYAIPSEYEFSSLILLLINADGEGKNLPNAEDIERIKALPSPLAIKTFMLLTCPNCPDVVQALNLVALYNKDATHSVLNTQTHGDEANKYGVEAVPAVFVNGELLHMGRAGLDVLLDKLELYAEGR